MRSHCQSRAKKINVYHVLFSETAQVKEVEKLMGDMKVTDEKNATEEDHDEVNSEEGKSPK